MTKRKRAQPIQLSDHFTYGRLLRFCIPPIAMTILTAFYSMADGYFISNYIGKTAFAAVNLIMPYICIIACIASMLGAGGSALVAKAMGGGEDQDANRYFTMVVMLNAILGVTLTILSLVFLRPIGIWLGETYEMMPYLITYGGIFMLFLTSHIMQNIFQIFLTTAEKPTFGLVLTIVAGIVDVVLNAVLIIGFRMGVVGAVLSTVIAQCIGTVVPLIYFLRPNNSRLRLVKTKIEWKPMLKACTNGASEFVNNISVSVVGAAYNFQLLRFAGENGVAAYGVLMYVQFIFIGVFTGYNIGAAPIFSFHFGAKNHTEQRSLLKKSLVLMTAAGGTMMGIAITMSDLLATLFVGYDPALHEMTKHAFVVLAASFLMAGINIFASSYFTALNDGKTSAIISFLRTFVFQILTVLILPVFWELEGVWLAITVAEVLTFGIAVTYLMRNRKELEDNQ